MAKKKNVNAKKDKELPKKQALGTSIEDIENPEWLYILSEELDEGLIDVAEISVLDPPEESIPDIPVEDIITLIPVEESVPDILSYQGDDQAPAHNILNFGDADNTHHGSAYVNNYIKLPSGATAWVFDGNPHDGISIRSSDQVDNLHDLTIEFLVYLNEPSESGAGRLFSKKQRTPNEENSFELYVDETDMCLTLTRGTIILGEVDTWKTKVNSLAYGNWYHIQVVWESGVGAGITPIIYQNNFSKPLTHVSVGSSLWATDDGSPIMIGNTFEGGYNINATVALFRIYKKANTPSVCTSNYLSDAWRLNNPALGATTVPGAPPPTDPDPILRIDKNLTALSVKVDYSKIITKLYPRGSGSAPSELTLDTPRYWPPFQELVLVSTDNNWAQFAIPGDYSCYEGYPAGGAPLPSGMLVGYGKTGRGSTTVAGQDGLSFNGSNWVAQTLHLDSTTRVWNIALYLSRQHFNGTTKGYFNSTDGEWSNASWPRIQIGIYNTQHNKDIDRYEPYQGPLVWSSVDLSAVPMDPQYGWVYFAVHGAPLTKGIYAIVANLYPTENWPYDNIWWRVTTTKAAGDPWGGSALYSTGGNAPGAWKLTNFKGVVPNEAQMNIYIESVAHDVTAQFSLSNTAHPGKYIRCPIANYNAGVDYMVHYKHAPYLMNWEGRDKYGVIEGTFKDDALTTADSLVKGASEYLKSIAEPVLTWEVSAIDLYNLDPSVNWAEELTTGTPVTVQDDMLGLDQKCMVSKISHPNLNNPYDLTIQLDNADRNAGVLLSNLAKNQITTPKYLQGQTVSTPYVTSQLADSKSPAALTFQINECSTIIPSVKLTVLPQPFQVATNSGVANLETTGKITVKVDGNVVKI